VRYAKIAGRFCDCRAVVGKKEERKKEKKLPGLSLQLLQHFVQFFLELTNLVRDFIVCFILTLYGQEIVIVCSMA